MDVRVGGAGRTPALADLGTAGWSANDDVTPGHVTSTETLRQQQQQLVREQDEGLDVLASVISRQKNMASAINVEIEEQTALIDDISDMADRSSGRIVQQTQQTRLVDRKASGTCCYWLVIIALLIAIIVVFLW